MLVSLKESFKIKPDHVYLAVVCECFQLILEGDEDSSGVAYVMCKHKSEKLSRLVHTEA